MTVLSDGASNYAKHYGIPVIPLQPRGKTPLTPHGVKDATTDLAQITEWWEREPEANIGLDAGGAGLLVLDFDTSKPEYAGHELLHELLTKYPTWATITGSDGRHLIYEQPPGVKLGNKIGKLPAGVDVRGHGGYIAAPPSVHPNGHRYEWLTGFEIWHIEKPAPLPDLVLQLLTAAPVRDIPPAVPSQPAQLGDFELLELIRKSDQGAEFDRLWAGDTSMHSGDHSRADAALLRMLAFYTGKDPAAMDRLFRQSGLYRPKWDRQDYRDRSIDDAIDNTPNVWRPSQRDQAAIDAAQAAVAAGGNSGPLDDWWDAYRPDESGQADAFLDHYGADWRFVCSWEKWHVWQGKYWQADEQRSFRRCVSAMLDDAHRGAEQKATKLWTDANAARNSQTDAKTQKDLDGAAKDASAVAHAWRRTDRRLNAIDNLCRDSLATHPDAINAGNLLNLANGTLNLDTYSLQPHERADMLTHCLPYEYDPDAACPRWLQFISEVLVKEDARTPDLELAALFQEAFGCALTVETLFETMFWLSGGGANGKSTATKIVNALLGDLALKLDFSALGRPDASYYLAKLDGARVVFSTEAATKTGEEILKQLVSGEPLSARPIRGEPITIHPVAKVFWAMNKNPDIKDTSDGFWRRLRLIPFNRQFSEAEKDTGLIVKLQAELPGILNWALDGLKRLRANGRFTNSSAVQSATNAYRIQQNEVALWLSERTTLGLPAAQRPAQAATPAAGAFADYLLWAKDTNRQDTMTATRFGLELGAIAPGSKGRNGKIYAFGLIY